MKKEKRPLKPHRNAIWDPKKNAWGWSIEILRKKIEKQRLRFNVKPKKKKVNTLRQKRQVQYEKIKKQWRKRYENHYCKPCSDAGLITTAELHPHHKKGRAGILLCDPLYFLPICHKCHNAIHAHPEIAYKKGYLIKSSSKL